MQTVMDRSRPEGGKDRDVDLLIEKGFLLLGSIEFQIDQHLMTHGTRIDPETRLFMAKVRDAAGDASARLLDEARSRVEAAPAAPPPQEAGGAGPTDSAASDAAAAAQAMPRRGALSSAKARRRSRRGFGTMAVDISLGTAAAALCAALLLSRSVPEAVPNGGTDTFVVAGTAPIDRSPQTGGPTGAHTGALIGGPVEAPTAAAAQPVAPASARERAGHLRFRPSAAYAAGPMLLRQGAMPGPRSTPELAEAGRGASAVRLDRTLRVGEGADRACRRRALAIGRKTGCGWCWRARQLPAAPAPGAIAQALIGRPDRSDRPDF